MLFLFPPSHVEQAPQKNPHKELGIVLEALEGVTESLTDGKPAQQPKAQISALQAWEKHKATLMPGMNSETLAKLKKAFADVKSRSGNEAAEAALDASDLLAAGLPDNRNSRLGAADRASMRAWIRVATGRWDAIPDLPAAFKRFIEQDKKAYGKTIANIETNLAAFRAGVVAKDASRSQKAAAELLELVDELEKPAAK